MKILILADDFPPRAVGGAGVVAAQVAAGYSARRHEVAVITTVRLRQDERSYQYRGITVHAICSDYPARWVAYRSLYNPSTVPKVRAIIDSFRPDAVHVHNIHRHLSYHMLKLAKRSGAKVLLTAHDCMLFHYGKFEEYIDPHDLSLLKTFNYKISPWKQLAVYRKRYNPFRNLIIRHYLKYCDKVCAVSGALEQALNQNGIHNTMVVHNGIDIAEWDDWLTGAPDMRAQKKLEKRPVIGFVGKMSGAKGGLLLLRAMKEVKKTFPDAMLLVIGPKECFVPNAEALANELGLTSSIIVTGTLAGSDLAAAYRACDVVAFPSVCLDTFGMVNLEAMATGKPVVATCFGGAPEVVVDGVTGCIVNPYNVQRMSAALVEFLGDAPKAHTFGQNGRARAEKDFSLDRQINEYLSLVQ